MSQDILTPREQQVLEAVIQSYVETAEPAGSRTIARKYRLGVSAATIRNTMSDLEDRGYLYHPHTSAGRIPTDLAYRVYVDRIMEPPRLSPDDEKVLSDRIVRDGSAIEDLLEKAAHVLGVVSHELGFVVSLSFDESTLEQLKLVSVSAGRLLMILVLRTGIARTVFIEIASHLPQEAADRVARVLNERLAGLTLREIRRTLGQRLRDSASGDSERELINIFVEEAEEIFGAAPSGQGVVVSSARHLADQPEFASEERMRELLVLTERRDLLQDAVRDRGGGLTITIGAENEDPKLTPFTLVSSTYEVDGLSGVIGVMGPTRMSYEKVIALVNHASRLMGDLR